MTQSTLSYAHEDIQEILFTEEQIQQRIAEIGAQISKDYADVAQVSSTDKTPQLLVVSVLRGAAIYMADLVRAIDLPLEMDYMAVSSYGSGVKSSGVVRIIKDLSSNIEGKHVIIAEDILDSGLTLKYLMRVLESRKPASIQIATLLRKKNLEQAKIDCAYIGFECPNEFIVGYGLDYAEQYRNLNYIGVLKPEVYGQ
ncbi:MAG: hypoxanthine phosphoribosyltransferase [Eggerthellaceae bacterium]|nr:hypoxanthine phosphoribosyltransferase [Eggerthellaceae bacterium]